MSELYALDVPDVDAAYAAARYSGGRVMLPFALGATSQAFMDTMGLVAACDAASRGVPARMVTMNFFGGNATPKGAMTELSAALGMSIMPTRGLRSAGEEESRSTRLGSKRLESVSGMGENSGHTVRKVGHGPGGDTLGVEPYRNHGRSQEQR